MISRRSIAAVVAVVGYGTAFAVMTPQLLFAQSVDAPMIIVATPPPTPTPPPPLNLPSDNVFRVADGAPGAAQAGGAKTGSVQESLPAGVGVIAMSLDSSDPRNSYATIDLGSTVRAYRIGESVLGHQIIGMSDAGVLLDNRAVIRVGLVTSSQDKVPAITATASPSPLPTLPQPSVAPPPVITTSEQPGYQYPQPQPKVSPFLDPAALPTPYTIDPLATPGAHE